MKNRAFAILVLVAIAIGCASGVVLQDKISPSANAQNMVSQSNTAGTGNFSECAGVTLWLTPGKDINDGKLPEKTVNVPSGWSVVGGGQGPHGANMIICR